MPITQLEIQCRDFEVKAAMHREKADRFDRLAAADEAAGRLDMAAEMKRSAVAEREKADKFSRLANPETAALMMKRSYART